MKSVFLFPLFVLLVFSVANAFGDEPRCSCNGLAGNYPGVSLICEGSVVERFPFTNGGDQGAMTACRDAMAEWMHHHGSNQQDCDHWPYTGCPM